MENGLTTEDVQLAICNGAYGGKQWSAAEREAACQQVGIDPHITRNSLLTAGGAALVVILVVVLGYVVYKRRFSKKSKTKTR